MLFLAEHHAFSNTGWDELNEHVQTLQRACADTAEGSCTIMYCGVLLQRAVVQSCSAVLQFL